MSSPVHIIYNTSQFAHHWTKSSPSKVIHSRYTNHIHIINITQPLQNEQHIVFLHNYLDIIPDLTITSDQPPSLL